MGSPAAISTAPRSPAGLAASVVGVSMVVAASGVVAAGSGLVAGAAPPQPTSPRTSRPALRAGTPFRGRIMSLAPPGSAGRAPAAWWQRRGPRLATGARGARRPERARLYKRPKGPSTDFPAGIAADRGRGGPARARAGPGRARRWMAPAT